MIRGYRHGVVSCRECFSGCERVREFHGWGLVNNPGYWGSSEPEILVLGFSKGANQNRVSMSSRFDEIAFAGCRGRLREILEVLGVMPPDRNIDALMTATEKKFGFTSLVRCSLFRLKNDKSRISSSIVSSAFADGYCLSIIKTCIRKYLGNLPPSVKLVVLLGVGKSYIQRTKNIFEELHDDFRSLNEVAFLAGGVLWIYATHPSPANGHFNAWLYADEESSLGKKRVLSLGSLYEYYKSPRLLPAG